MARVLLAPDKFKGTLTATEVAAFLADGIRAADPAIDIVTVPVADGGDGLLDALGAAGYERVPLTASGPVGDPVQTWWARDGSRAVVELAAVCGLALLGSRLAPLTATTRGLGEAIAAAIEAGCTEVLVGIGGSASTDGGLGMVQALGARVLDADGVEVGPGANGAAGAATLEMERLRRLLTGVRVEFACDVDNPLTGDRGAAAVYGPQKGADAGDVARMDAALTNWADLVARTTGSEHRADPGAGAAGGVGFGGVALLGAALRPGADLVLDAVGLRDRLVHVDLVVTGEGALDEQTLNGKAPARVAAAARDAGVPVVAVAGRCTLDGSRARAAGFDAVHVLVDEAADADEPFRDPGRLLRAIGTRIAGSLASAPRSIG
jgi:glycerate kinase